MTDEHEALVERLRSLGIQAADLAATALETEHAARIAAEAERDASVQRRIELDELLERANAAIKDLGDKLELERALTDGAHRRARAAEAERDQERAERLNREKWRHAAIARAEAAEAREREATALLREAWGAYQVYLLDKDDRPAREVDEWAEAVGAFLAGSPAPRDGVDDYRTSPERLGSRSITPLTDEQKHVLAHMEAFATEGAEARWIKDTEAGAYDEDAPRDVVGGLAAYERREAWKDKRDAAFRAQEDRT